MAIDRAAAWAEGASLRTAPYPLLVAAPVDASGMLQQSACVAIAASPHACPHHASMA